MRVDAFIFDLDGTLADSIADIGTAMNSVLRAHSLPEHSLTSYKSFVGEGAEVLVRRAFAASSREPAPAELPALCEAYRVEYAKVDHAQSTPYPGVFEMLDAVARSGRPMAVLSNKRDDFTKQLVAHSFAKWRFVDVRGEREGVPRKPDPTAAFELSLALNVMPHRIGFVGDTPIDVKTALHAGMIPFAALWGFRSKAELSAAGATTFLSAPTDLLAHL